MKKRPWIPIALVLLVLLGATLVAGSALRSRLSQAELALEPFMAPDLVDVIGNGDDFPTPPCQGAPEIANAIRGFYEALEIERIAAIEAGNSPIEISTTDPTFDSFMLKSAIARMTAGKHQLLLHARPGSGAWCVDEVEFNTEE